MSSRLPTPDVSDQHIMTASADAALRRLVEIMARLRDREHGCPWDVEQNFETIAPYTIEEAYEVADAIARGDMADLLGELGDLQLQVVFHARMAEEAGIFALDDVITGIADKLIRRHPHVFEQNSPKDPGHSSGSEVQRGWEAIKAAERTARSETGALSGVALGLPALLRAEKLQRRAARTGFDWSDMEGPRAKVLEEMEEIAQAKTPAERTEEFGDLLFAVVNWARHSGIDAEAALRSANAKFERRFAAMEALAGPAFSALSPANKEALWRDTKRAEKA